MEHNVHVKLVVIEGDKMELRPTVSLQIIECWLFIPKHTTSGMSVKLGIGKLEEGHRGKKYRVLMRMIQFDHVMGSKPDESVKWGKVKRFYALCDASSLLMFCRNSQWTNTDIFV